MTKKRFVAILLCVTLVALAAIGATFAYLTDSKTVNNTFTMGNVAIKLDETNVNDPTGDRVTSNAYNVYPGAVVTKDPIVHNTGKNAAYIRATVNVSNWMNLCAAYYPESGFEFTKPGYEKSLELLVGTLGEGWSVVGVEAGDTFTIGQFDAKFILKYDGELAAGDDTTAMFQTVTIPTGIDNASTDSFSGVKVVAQAIQADGFDTWEAAFAAYDAK
ncbi:MAG: SipW-dependent-type signal peptide-containing protein [Firmicutes bacterium]|nr:SipW-dependent-type signal peptide-containing protein [Bacillota bacterium]